MGYQSGIWNRLPLTRQEQLAHMDLGAAVIAASEAEADFFVRGITAPYARRPELPTEPLAVEADPFSDLPATVRTGTRR